MTRKTSAVLLLFAVVLSGCEKNAVQDITGPLAGSRIKFFNFGLGAPGVNFYANDMKITAISSTTPNTESTNGTGFGSVGSGGFYSAIEPGQYTLTGKIAAAVDKDLAISNLSVTIADGKSYSYYMSGVYNTTTKTVDSFVVEDPVPSDIDPSVTYVRFVNAISNSSPMTLFVQNTTTAAETAVGAAVAYKAAGAFVSLPPGAYNLSTRTAGSGANAIVRTAVSFSAGRVYTIGARGDMTITSTTATNRPFLDNTANR